MKFPFALRSCTIHKFRSCLPAKLRIGQSVQFRRNRASARLPNYRSTELIETGEKSEPPPFFFSKVAKIHLQISYSKGVQSKVSAAECPYNMQRHVVTGASRKLFYRHSERRSKKFRYSTLKARRLKWPILVALRAPFSEQSRMSRVPRELLLHLSELPITLPITAASSAMLIFLR